jgi:hypothetical protein
VPLQRKARKSDGRSNPPGCPISGGSAIRPHHPQRFTLLIFLERVFSFKVKAFISLSGGRDPYLKGQGCRATPQMDFLRYHQYFLTKIELFRREGGERN